MIGYNLHLSVAGTTSMAGRFVEPVILILQIRICSLQLGGDHSMTPEIFLYSEIITDKYDFMRTYEKAHNGKEQDLVYDKQQKAVFHYTLYNRDYKYQKYLSLKGKNINDEIVSVESLDAFDLIRDNKKGYLQGELKEIASKMTEEDNAVILLMKCKK